jgi:Calcineurin-like phosphoesterase
MPYSILHISDLHRSPSDPISNDELVSALLSDRTRYVNEEPGIRSPDAIIVSGDIIQGVPLNTTDYAVELSRQYATAEAFLAELTERILGGDRSRVVIVPGNHDIDWNSAFAAMSPVGAADEPTNIAGELHKEASNFRWDWRNRQLYRIVDEKADASRLEAFWKFFERFYQASPTSCAFPRGPITASLPSWTTKSGSPRLIHAKAMTVLPTTAGSNSTPSRAVILTWTILDILSNFALLCGTTALRDHPTGRTIWTSILSEA